MYALDGNVKARARSSPALICRSCVIDTRRSLRSARPGHFGTDGRCLAGQNIVDGMAPADDVEDDPDRDDDRHRYQHGDLKGCAVNATGLTEDGSRQQPWPERKHG